MRDQKGYVKKGKKLAWGGDGGGSGKSICDALIIRAERDRQHFGKGGKSGMGDHLSKNHTERNMTFWVV